MMMMMTCGLFPLLQSLASLIDTFFLFTLLESLSSLDIIGSSSSRGGGGGGGGGGGDDDDQWVQNLQIGCLKHTIQRDCLFPLSKCSSWALTFYY